MPDVYGVTSDVWAELLAGCWRVHDEKVNVYEQERMQVEKWIRKLICKLLMVMIRKRCVAHKFAKAQAANSFRIAVFQVVCLITCKNYETQMGGKKWLNR